MKNRIFKKYNTNTFYQNNYNNLIGEYDAELVAIDIITGLFKHFGLQFTQK